MKRICEAQENRIIWPFPFPQGQARNVLRQFFLARRERHDRKVIVCTLHHLGLIASMPSATDNCSAVCEDAITAINDSLVL